MRRVNKIIQSMATVIVMIISYFYTPLLIVSAQGSSLNDFDSLLRQNNVTVSEGEYDFSAFEYEGLLREAEIESATYAKSKNNDGSVNLSYKEILELDYYSKTEEQRAIFWHKVNNQHIDIQVEDGIILISYNVNIP